MPSICENIQQIKSHAQQAQLVVVSKYRKLEELQEVYSCGQRDFAENRVQELMDRHEQLPNDIRWHLIGHLQSNKVKYIAPFIHLIHAVDSLKLLKQINKEAAKNERIIDFLFQIHIAQEEHKFGLGPGQLAEMLEAMKVLPHVRCKGLMGMATLTEDQGQIRSEFAQLKQLFDNYAEEANWDTLSMGMSGDYKIAVEEGSTMLRVGSRVFYQ